MDIAFIYDNLALRTVYQYHVTVCTVGCNQGYGSALSRIMQKTCKSSLYAV